MQGVTAQQYCPSLPLPPSSQLLNVPGVTTSEFEQSYHNNIVRHPPPPFSKYHILDCTLPVKWICPKLPYNNIARHRCSGYSSGVLRGWQYSVRDSGSNDRRRSIILPLSIPYIQRTTMDTLLLPSDNTHPDTSAFVLWSNVLVWLGSN